MLTQEHISLQSTAETVYRMNADDYVREECRAREDNLRLQRSIQKKHERELKRPDYVQSWSL
ncbi:MAG: hypothetical protein ACI4FZ_08445 [Lachnospiraceae bacterium]